MSHSRFITPSLPVAVALLALAPGNAQATSASTHTTTPVSDSPARGPNGLRGGTGCGTEGWPWGCLAACESSGRWHINTGNGFYGGLQFSQSTWRRHGGLAFARRADLATPGEQIKIARAVQRVQGWGAWPACSQRFGLSGRGRTGGDGVSSGNDSRHSKHRKQTEQRRQTVESKQNRPASTSHAVRSIHVVRKGESLSSIAQRYMVRGGWPALYRTNAKTVGGNPHLINIGARIRIP